MFVQVDPPFVVTNTLLPAEYPEKVTKTFVASKLSTAILVICADAVGKPAVILAQVVPLFVVLYKFVDRDAYKVAVLEGAAAMLKTSPEPAIVPI